MKKQVIVYVDVPDDAPDNSTYLNDLIESSVEANLPTGVYIIENDEVIKNVPLVWGGVTCRDAGPSENVNACVFGHNDCGLHPAAS